MISKIEEYYLSQKVIDKVESVTNTNYESVNGKIPIENITCMIEDLLIIIDGLREKNEEEYEPDYDEIGKDIRMGIYE